MLSVETPTHFEHVLTGKDGGPCKRRVETCNAGRAGTHLPSEALHRTRLSVVLTRIARELRVPTTPHTPYPRRAMPVAR